jgi:predicted glutamine amidotransferase
MCGIAGIHMKTPGQIPGYKLDRLVDELFLGIESRGRDASGFAACTVGGKSIQLAKEAKPAHEFIKGRPSLGPIDPVRTVILHTRFATQGHQSKNVNNHPVVCGTTFVVHNGHIGNDSELFRKKELVRCGEVDSEIIPALLQGEAFANPVAALEELDGNLAIAAISPSDYPDQLILAKGWGSPLIMHENEHFIIWASTVEAIRNAWGKVFGTPPRPDKFLEFTEGGILMVNGAETTEATFEPLESWQKWYRNGRLYQDTLTKEEKDVLCAMCGCKRVWHSGFDYDGHCVNAYTHNGQSMRCFCTDFMDPDSTEAYRYGIRSASKGSEDEGFDYTAYAQCDSCHNWVSVTDLRDVYDSVTLCEDCISDDEKPLLQLVSGDSCTTMEFPDADLDEEEGVWSELATGTERERLRFLISEVADRTGNTEKFTEWILFRADGKIVNADPWLASVQDECGQAYADAEKELDEWMDDIDSPGSIKDAIRRIFH